MDHSSQLAVRQLMTASWLECVVELLRLCDHSSHHRPQLEAASSRHVQPALPSCHCKTTHQLPLCRLDTGMRSADRHLLRSSGTYAASCAFFFSVVFIVCACSRERHLPGRTAAYARPCKTIYTATDDKLNTAIYHLPSAICHSSNLKRRLVSTPK